MMNTDKQRASTSERIVSDAIRGAHLEVSEHALKRLVRASYGSFQSVNHSSRVLLTRPDGETNGSFMLNLRIHVLSALKERLNGICRGWIVQDHAKRSNSFFAM